MYLFKRQRPDLKAICTLVQKFSIAKKSHYEVLNVRKNCTEKEIKDAFIKLSKEYHPDKNKSSQAQQQFVEIVEAYNVLSKPGSRSRYDLNSHHTSNSNVYKTYPSYDYKYKAYNNQFYNNYTNNNSTNQNQTSDAYYGLKGIRKVPNVVIIMICFGVAIVGLFLQILVISRSYHFHRKRIDEKSIRLAEELEKVRASARGKTNEMQTQQILDKIVTAANPSIATASLGQALATEKKNLKNDSEIKDPEDIPYNNSVNDMKFTLYELIKNIISYVCYLF
ncbi:dnaJ-like protein 60 isoform X1 [Danaus plexippus]|nr:dnaJ-like protein 60 isoform X1 [Danaus plexippus]